MFKLCGKCEQIKSVDEFHKNARKSDGLQSQCKSCKKDSDKALYAANPQRYKDSNKKNLEAVREFVRKAKEVPCADCKVSYPYYVMDFDHLGHEAKVSDISKMQGLNMIKVEIAKCEVVCANCHRIRTHVRFDSSSPSC